MSPPQPDWPDVLPSAFVVQAKRGPFALALVAVVALIIVAAVIGNTSETTVRIASMAVAAGLGFVAVLLGFRLLQAGKPAFVADAAGVMTTLLTDRLPWERIERVRVIPSTSKRGARIGITPISLAEALPARTDSKRLISMLESRERREGAPLIVSLSATGVTPEEATRRLTELAAGRCPVTS